MKLPLAEIGPESEKGVVSALDDLFGPSFRTLGEYLADKVRYHRLRSLQKILRRAKDFGPSAIEFLAPPPMKFLLPYVEGSSLEEGGDEVMCDMWAKLLADASSEFDSKQLHFVRILKDITGKEARLLHAIATEARIDPSIRGGWIGDLEFARMELTQSSAVDFLRHNIGRIPNEKLAFEFIRRNEYPGAHVSFIHVGVRLEDVGYQTVDDDFSGNLMGLERDHGSLTFELLASLSLISEVRSELVEVGDIGLEFNAWTMTALGAEFYRSCTQAAFKTLQAD